MRQILDTKTGNQKNMMPGGCEANFSDQLRRSWSKNDFVLSENEQIAMLLNMKFVVLNCYDIHKSLLSHI